MAFVPKEWKDRLVEFAGRRKLTNVSTGEEIIVDVVRNEGTVSQEGDAFSAANMSDLEQRVADEFNNINTNLTWKTLGTTVGTSGIEWTDFYSDHTEIGWIVNRNGLRFYGTIPIIFLTATIGTATSNTSCTINGQSNAVTSSNMWNCVLSAYRSNSKYYIKLSSLTYNGNEYAGEGDVIWFVKG